jgi:large subunit GTPase 1
MTRVPIKADTYISQVGEEGAATALSTTRQSSRAKALDRNFFARTLVGQAGVRGVAGEKNGSEFTRVRMFPHQIGVLKDDGTLAPKARKKRGDKKAAAAAAAAGGDADDKKHKKPARVKQRSGRGYDD